MFVDYFAHSGIDHSSEVEAASHAQLTVLAVVAIATVVLIVTAHYYRQSTNSQKGQRREQND